jgi:hypothetical protein
VKYEWSDLSDSELRAKLENRGVPASYARHAVLQRDDPKVQLWIDQRLRA